MSKNIDDPISDYLTVGEAAKLFGVCGTTLRNWDKQGKLKAHRNPMNRYRLYERAQILALLERIKKSCKD